jgi:hypothetical protein
MAVKPQTWKARLDFVKRGMRKKLIFAGSSLLAIACFRFASAADAPGFAGEYADKKFLNGQAVFQMSLEQNGNTVAVWFTAVYNDGRGCAPEAEGKGNVTSKGTLEFTFKDGEGNSGNGTITRSGTDMTLSIKPTHVADPRCVVFYKQNIRLKHVAKK